jgi:hypothetical protein
MAIGCHALALSPFAAESFPFAVLVSPLSHAAAAR